MEINNRFTSKQTVRFRDLDAIGHVNNATYFTYMEEARKDFFYHLFDSSSPGDFPFILAAVSCNFNKPIRLEDNVMAVDLWVSHIGRKSFTFRHEIYRPEEPSWIFATGESIQVYYDHANDKSIEIPADFKTKIEKYIIQEKTS
ncbi:MAG: thioesterase family protein [Pseudomonadota bacterium]|nr:thioesterase family protein [Pseudomonadota bacterium]